MTHAMIDIETLGVGVSAPLFEIGICVFDNTQILKSDLFRVDILDVMFKTGFIPQRETLEWWSKQEYDPTNHEDFTWPLKSALHALNRFMDEHGVRYVWANSPSFDLVILERHYEAVGIPKRWSYSRELDFRTVKYLAKEKAWPGSGDEPTHNAREDAILQAKLLLEMLSYV